MFFQESENSIWGDHHKSTKTAQDFLSEGVGENLPILPESLDDAMFKDTTEHMHHNPVQSVRTVSCSAFAQPKEHFFVEIEKDAVRYADETEEVIFGILNDVLQDDLLQDDIIDMTTTVPDNHIIRFLFSQDFDLFRAGDNQSNCIW